MLGSKKDFIELLGGVENNDKRGRGTEKGCRRGYHMGRNSESDIGSMKDTRAAGTYQIPDNVWK